MGSAAGVVLYWLVYQGDDFFPILVLPFLVTLAIWSSQVYARESGRTDPQEIVVDEVAGQWLCLLGSTPTVPVLIVGFLAFRLFDIWKPFRRVENLPGGWGIVMDDLLAGILGWVTISLARLSGYL
jgi:phosphatidylglycerophosphatase A